MNILSERERERESESERNEQLFNNVLYVHVYMLLKIFIPFLNFNFLLFIAICHTYDRLIIKLLFFKARKLI